MKRTTLKLNALTIIQLEAGEHQVVVENGNVYVQIQSVADLGGSETAQEDPKAREEVVEEVQKTNEKKFTEKELMDMETSDLLDLCEDYGIDPNKFEGKNTNKKLRGLILDFQAGKLEQPIAEEEGETAEVVDDTKPATTGRARRGATKKQEPKVIENWDKLKEGELVLVKMDIDDPATKDKLWEAEVVGWDVPEGLDEEYLFVRFIEDGQEDYLRDGDVIYEFQKEL